MDEQRKDSLALEVAADALARPRLAFDDRVDRFQVARVGRQANVDLMAVIRLPLGSKPR